jgi:hypothetical protein
VVGPFAVAGYDVLAPLDEAGRRWRAICLADGRPVLLRRWIGAGEGLSAARRRAALWSSAGGDAVVRVRDVRRDGADLVVVSEARGDHLDHVLARRGPLTAGQIVTLVVGLAAPLAEAHRRGLAHGRLDASSVVIGDDGRPRLTDYAIGGDAAPSADVAALVAMVWESIDSTTPAAVVRALESADDARGLAESVLATTHAESLLSPPEVAAPTFVAKRRATGVRVRPAVVITTAVAVVATVLGVWWGRQEPAAGAPPPRVSPRPSPSPSTSSLRDVVVQLDRQRMQALAHADIEALAAVEVTDTALWHRDSRTVTRLMRTHLHLHGLRVHVRAVTVLSAGDRRVVVRVVDALSPYVVVDATGVVHARHAARRLRATDLVLHRDDDQWLLQNVQ